jgi:hypothetical protein
MQICSVVHTEVWRVLQEQEATAVSSFFLGSAAPAEGERGYISLSNNLINTSR